MVPGDITTYTDHAGQQRVAIVLEVLPDGRYSVFCPKPTFIAVEAHHEPGQKATLFDPTLPAPSDPPVTSGTGDTTVLQSVPMAPDGSLDHPADSSGEGSDTKPAE